jgi:DNA-binding transcriptional MocR family regulator
MEPTPWIPVIEDDRTPAYVAIADAIAADVRAGRLRPGQRLPPQRILAERLGFDFTTVGRAYAEARRRGDVEARVGQGTFVRGTRRRAPAEVPRPAAPPAPRLVDMMMNQPPIPEDPALAERLSRGALAVLAEADPAGWLLRYPDAGDREAGRAAGLRWLASCGLVGVEADRVVVCPGTQSAMLSLLSALTRPGDAVLTEALTYPGFKAVASQLGLRLVGLPMDAEGLDPDALRAACAEHRPKALYCTPTLHNPTTATMSAQRRRAVASVLRERGLPAIEDGIYAPLAEGGPPPLAALAPELTYHVAGLAKCLSPALRIAYLVAPDARRAQQVAAAQRATSLMASPLTAAVAARLIEDGTAAAVLGGVRTEAMARQRMARALLPPDLVSSRPEAYHLWLGLPDGWTRAEFAAHLRAQGIAVAVSDTFAAPPSRAPEALRICLGAAADRAETRWVLDTLAQALDQSRAPAIGII